MEISADFEILPGMAGNVKYYKRPCPFKEKSMFGMVTMVGSTSCKMCQYYEETNEVLTESGDVYAECVIYKHDPNS